MWVWRIVFSHLLFSKILDISIRQYSFIDFPEVCSLIDAYVSCVDIERIPYSLHSCYQYGADISCTELFLISNYCFTEIEEVHREKYISELFNKVTHGFIIWQTVFRVSISTVDSIQKPNVKIEPERPQTAPRDLPNFFVFF